MRTSHWLLALGVASAFVGTVAAGCGGSTNNTPPPKEAGADGTTTDAAKEAAPEAAVESGPADAPAEAACVPVDANLETFPIPDSGLPDAGVDIGACVSCLRQDCQSELAACQSDCVCLDAIAGCLSSGAIDQSCVGGALSDTNLLALGLCVEQTCSSTCLPATAKDGGGDSSTDAPSDSPSE